LQNTVKPIFAPAIFGFSLARHFVFALKAEKA